MLVGYARVSTTDQTLSLQKDALEQANCDKLFTDTVSGVKAERKGLDEALDYVRAGDTLVVWRLDRLGRSLPHLIDTMAQLDARNIGFRSLTENIDTTTSGGRLIFHIFGALAEFERDLIKERTTAGLQAARKRGRLGGRPNLLSARKIALLQELYEGKGEKERSIKEICRSRNISKTTLYRHVRKSSPRQEGPKVAKVEISAK